MFGSIEQPVHWARHITRTRALQRETGGFTEFVPLPFVHMATPIYLQRKARRGPTFPRGAAHARGGPHRLRRLHRQHPGELGEDGRRRARQILQAGPTTSAAPSSTRTSRALPAAAHGQMMGRNRFPRHRRAIGRRLEQRTTLYGRVALA